MLLKKPKITKRMQIFVAEATADGDFWDLCCDHGYVGLYALRQNRFQHIYFVDPVPSIMSRLKNLLDQVDVDPSLYTLHCKKGEEITETLCGNVLIAGVGGKTVETIVTELLEKKCLQAEKLLLSPNTDQTAFLNLLNSELFQMHYALDKKVDLDEGGFIKSLFVFNLKIF